MKRNPGESIAQINVEFKGVFCFVFIVIAGLLIGSLISQCTS